MFILGVIIAFVISKVMPHPNNDHHELFDYLMQNGVITDWREPNVIRLAPVPFYCSFEDMYEFGQILKQGITK